MEEVQCTYFCRRIVLIIGLDMLKSAQRLHLRSRDPGSARGRRDSLDMYTRTYVGRASASTASCFNLCEGIHGASSTQTCAGQCGLRCSEECPRTSQIQGVLVLRWQVLDWARGSVGAWRRLAPVRNKGRRALAGMRMLPDSCALV